MINNEHCTIEKLKNILLKEDFSGVYQQADDIQKKEKHDIVEIRGILEFSNYCKRRCVYCGLNCNNHGAVRYRMTPKEMVATGFAAHEAGYKTLVMQSGEDDFYTPQLLGEIVKEIKKTGISITLSCGEQSYDAYAYLKQCGADRYLLKHETADEGIYSTLHPCGTLLKRVACLKNLKSLGYETGSGFMIGLPNQTEETIAKDILLLKEIGCEMAGIGPFIPHPQTPLKNHPHGATELTKRAVALTRILMPTINLPATTSLGVIDGNEKSNIFFCGANVIMRKVTPSAYKAYYEIYPSHLEETDILKERKELEEMLTMMGKTPR